MLFDMTSSTILRRPLAAKTSFPLPSGTDKESKKETIGLGGIRTRDLSLLLAGCIGLCPCGVCFSQLPK
jgi:hypothetical protein